ncbi:uncharacterized protein LOC128236503 [Mya arenaria]|uniref:uncharacterized protein LOC128236503 n=1 Tax=Mya arenaria TaxID=6604 RepID=UPI0022E16707|nr:uncharacterized protein LOC128236503 [Mya arenaria]
MCQMSPKALKQCLVVFAIITFCMSIAKIVVGAIYMDDCPYDKLISVWPIISGLIPLLYAPMLLRLRRETWPDTWEECREKDPNEGMGTADKVADFLAIIGLLVLIAWQIVGAVLVYPNRSKFNNATICSDTVTTNCIENCSTVLLNFGFGILTYEWSTFWMWCNVTGRILYRMYKTNCGKQTTGPMASKGGSYS